MYTEIQFDWFLLVESVCWLIELHQDPSSGLHMAWKCRPGKIFILLLLASSRTPCLGISLAPPYFMKTILVAWKHYHIIPNYSKVDWTCLHSTVR